MVELIEEYQRRCNYLRQDDSRFRTEFVVDGLEVVVGKSDLNEVIITKGPHITRRVLGTQTTNFLVGLSRAWRRNLSLVCS